MGRIKVEGENLIDIDEAKKQLGVSRATIYRMIDSGRLVAVHVAGAMNTYITQDSVTLAKQPQETVKVLYPEDLLSPRSAEMIKSYPEAFKKYQESMKRQDRPWNLPPPRRRPESPEPSENDQPLESEE